MASLIQKEIEIVDIGEDFINSIIEELHCPITQCLILDPVQANDGKIYERYALKKSLDSGYDNIQGIKIISFQKSYFAANLIKDLIKKYPELKEKQFIVPDPKNLIEALKYKNYEQIEKFATIDTIDLIPSDELKNALYDPIIIEIITGIKKYHKLKRKTEITHIILKNTTETKNVDLIISIVNFSSCPGSIYKFILKNKDNLQIIIELIQNIINRFKNKNYIFQLLKK